MLNETYISLDEEQKIIENEIISTHKELIITKDIKNINTENENFSHWNIAISISKQMSVLVIHMIFQALRFLLLFVFSREKGKNFLAGVSSVIPLYFIFSTGVPWATVQYMAYRVGYYFGKGEPRNLGLAVNKALLYNLIISIIITLSFIFIVPLIFSKFFHVQETIDVIYKISRLMSISIPTQYLQCIMINYFLAIKQLSHIPYAHIIALAIQIILQCIIILGFNDHIVGVAISFTIAQLFVVSYHYYFFVFRNNYEKSSVKFNFAETIDGFLNYVEKAVPVGLIVFLNLISIDLLQFLSIADGQYTFTAYSILTNLFSLLQTFNKSLSTANNNEINRSIGQNKFQYYKRIIFVSLILVTIYSLVISIVLEIFLVKIMSIYTNDDKILGIINSLRTTYVFMFLSNSYIFMLGESLACFGNSKIPLLNLLIFRFIGTISLAFLFYYVFSFGLISFMLSFVINNFCIVLSNGYFLFKTVDEFIEKSKKLSNLNK